MGNLEKGEFFLLIFANKKRIFKYLILRGKIFF